MRALQSWPSSDIWRSKCRVQLLQDLYHVRKLINSAEIVRINKRPGHSLNELSSTPSAGDEENKMAPLLAVIGFPTDALIGWRFQQTTRSAENGETVTRVSKCFFRNLNSSEIISHKLRLLVASNVWFNIFSPVGGDTEGLRGRTAARQQLAGSIPKLWDAEADAAHDIGLVSQVLFSSWAPELLRERYRRIQVSKNCWKMKSDVIFRFSMV